MTLKLIEETISVLETLREDAEMALDGRWDVAHDDGGFKAQINAIDELVNKLKKEML
jgi:hypothetical protein